MRSQPSTAASGSRILAALGTKGPRQLPSRRPTTPKPPGDFMTRLRSLRWHGRQIVAGKDVRRVEMKSLVVELVCNEECIFGLRVRRHKQASEGIIIPLETQPSFQQICELTGGATISTGDTLVRMGELTVSGKREADTIVLADLIFFALATALNTCRSSLRVTKFTGNDKASAPDSIMFMVTFRHDKQTLEFRAIVPPSGLSEFIRIV